MKTVIVGAGSIGTRHAKLVYQLAAPEILVVEPDDGRLSTFLQAIPARPVTSLQLALEQHPDMAIICSPTSMHASHCLQALRAGCHVLLEKPLSDNLDDVNLLVDEARSRGCVVLVGCNFRFDPALLQMKQWLAEGIIGRPLTCRASYGQDLRQSRPGRDYRTVYSSSRAMGGGVLLDSVHEIDYLSWFFGPIESVSAMTGKLSALEMDTEDSANMLLRFCSGTRALVQLDYFRPEYNRSCEIIGTDGILQWSYSPKMVRYFSRQFGLWVTRMMDENVPPDIMYLQQLRHFLACIAHRDEPAQSISDAAEAVRVALSALESAKVGREVQVRSMERPTVASSRLQARAIGLRPDRPSKTIAIIQARMNSTRLPGKVLADICGMPMLMRVIKRARAVTSVSEVVVATSTNPADDAIASLCATQGVDCFRGSEQDVLDRYYRCAERAVPEAIVRITADCPLIDPQLIHQVIRTFQETGADYASNRSYWRGVISSSYPDGQDTEVFSFAALRRAWQEARLPSEREHVTPYIWKNPASFMIVGVAYRQDLSGLRWTVDEQRDLEFVRSIYRRLGDQPFGIQEVMSLLSDAPELLDINSGIFMNEGYLKSIQHDSLVVQDTPHR